MPRPKRSDLELARAAAELWEADDQEVGYLARLFTQTSLPYRDPGDVPVWARRNGNLLLTVQPGMTVTPDGAPQTIGYPYGTVPRLLLSWLSTEAVRTGSRELVLGDSLTDFMRGLGLTPTGGEKGTIKRLRRQMERLFQAHLTVRSEGDDRQLGAHLSVASGYELWWSPKPDAQLALMPFTSTAPGGRATFDLYDITVCPPTSATARQLAAARATSARTRSYRCGDCGARPARPGPAEGTGAGLCPACGHIARLRVEQALLAAERELIAADVAAVLDGSAAVVVQVDQHVPPPADSGRARPGPLPLEYEWPGSMAAAWPTSPCSWSARRPGGCPSTPSPRKTARPRLGKVLAGQRLVVWSVPELDQLHAVDPAYPTAYAARPPGGCRTRSPATWPTRCHPARRTEPRYSSPPWQAAPLRNPDPSEGTGDIQGWHGRAAARHRFRCRLRAEQATGTSMSSERALPPWWVAALLQPCAAKVIAVGSIRGHFGAMFT